MGWSDEQLAALPKQSGFRLRGLEMTRLETFIDAAFAFATTMLVISLSGFPNSVAELTAALKDIPAFLGSFVSIASFWWAHRKWSRRYGLEDAPATLISLALVFVMLIYVYPLKMGFSAMFAWLSNGWLPSSFALSAIGDMGQLFIIYGVGFSALTGLLGLLYGRALRAGDELALDDLERIRTWEELESCAVLSLTGLSSAMMALLTPPAVAVWSGFCYATLVITMPLSAARYERKARQLAEPD